MFAFISFTLLSFGLLVLCGIHPSINDIKVFTEKFRKKTHTGQQQKQPLRQFVLSLEGNKKENFIVKTNVEAKTALELIGQKGRFKRTQGLSLIVGAGGFTVGLLAGNIFLAAILCVGCYCIPMWCTRFAVYRYTKEVNDELSVSLSHITTSYIRNNDIVAAVKENLEHMNGFVAAAFRSFITGTQLNPNLVTSLVTLQREIENPLFISWIDTVILCQEDHGIRYALPGIVQKFSVLKKMQMENETKMLLPLRYALMVTALLIGFIPFVYFLNTDWFNALFNSFLGQASLCAASIAALAIINKAINLSGPIEFSL